VEHGYLHKIVGGEIRGSVSPTAQPKRSLYDFATHPQPEIDLTFSVNGARYRSLLKLDPKSRRMESYLFNGEGKPLTNGKKEPNIPILFLPITVPPCSPPLLQQSFVVLLSDCILGVKHIGRTVEYSSEEVAGCAQWEPLSRLGHGSLTVAI